MKANNKMKDHDFELKFSILGRHLNLRSLFWLMMSLGWMMGLVFPAMVFPFVTFKSSLHFLAFWASCLLAGSIVGSGCYFLTRSASTGFLLSAMKIAEEKIGIKLTESANNLSNYELAELSLYNLLDVTGALMRESRKISKDISYIANTLEKLSTKQASSSTEQVASIAEATATVEELVQTSAHIVNNSKLVEEAAKKTLIASMEGSNAVRSSVQHIDSIKSQSEDLATQIQNLTVNVSKVSEVLSFIDEMADQTKILALNASIEAARAGEAGKGFTVVAQEIKKLADSVVESTGRIREIVVNVSDLASNLTFSTEQSLKSVEKGKLLSDETLNSLKQIESDASQTSKASEMIVVATQQEKIGIQQIAVAMKEIEKSARESAEVITKLSDVAKELSGAADSLVNLMAKITVSVSVE